MTPRTPFQINRAVIFALLLREMRTRLGQRRMGAFWMLAEPIIQLALMTIVMGILRGRGPMQGVPYQVYLLTAIGPFWLCRGIAMLIIEGLAANRGLFAYKQVMPMDTFVARTIMQCCLSSISYVFMLAAFAWYGFDVSINRPLEWLGLIAMGVAFAFGMGMVFSVLVDIFPPLKTFIRFLFLILYLSSGALLPITRFPDYILVYLQWNPFLHMIDLIRQMVFPYYEGTIVTSFYYFAACTIVFLCVGLGLFRIRSLRMLAIKGIV